jgi:dTDP-4-dehydrorhamnose reductase
MKVVILGANGFIGSYLKKNLKRKDREIISITRKDLDITNELDVKKWLLEIKPNVIINCAILLSKIGTLNNDTDRIDLDKERNNYLIFQSFFNNADLFDKFINIGSGAEFDKTLNIENVDESELYNRYPKDSYGYSKNIISRLCKHKDNFYTLRLFSIYHHTEPPFRLFKNLINCFNSEQEFTVADRWQDFISMQDFCKIIDYYIDNNSLPKDINCVYSEKTRIIDLVSIFCELKNIPKDILIVKENNLNYTANGDKLKKLNIQFDGHSYGLKDYAKYYKN